MKTIVTSEELCCDVEDIHHNHDDIIEGDLLSRIARFDFWELKVLDIDCIDLNQFSIYDHLVDDYMKEIKNNPNYPPVIIDDKSYSHPSIIDGTHRLNALDKLGYKKVKAFVPYIKR
jgi:hypothetical protein